MLKIKHLNHAFEEKIIFKDASIVIPDSTVIWLQGENGSGKTTFYKIVSGLLEPSDIDGLVITENNQDIDLDMLKKNINFIPNIPYLFNYLSGQKNLEYLIELFELGDRKDEINNNINELGLLDDLDKEVRTYSLGMKAKLYLGIMLERKTNVLLIDELLNNLDVDALNSIVQLLKRKVVEEHMSILITSHTPIIREEFPINIIKLKEHRFEYEK